MIISYRRQIDTNQGNIKSDISSKQSVRNTQTQTQDVQRTTAPSAGRDQKM